MDIHAKAREIPSHATDYLCQVWEECTQNNRCYRVDATRCAIFWQYFLQGHGWITLKTSVKESHGWMTLKILVKAKSPCERHASDYLCPMWKEPTKNCRWGYGDHDDVIKWRHFPRYWPFVRRIHRSPVNSPHKGQWRGALMFTLICARIKGWVNNCEAGDLRRNRAHYDVIVMFVCYFSRFVIKS